MNQTVATVNGSPITEQDLQTTLQSLASEQFRARYEEIPEESRGALRHMAVERLIARELMFQAAMSEGIVASATDVEEELKRIMRQMGSPEDFWTKLGAAGIDEDLFARMVRKDVTVEKMTTRIVDQISEPSEEEIQQFFNEHTDRLKTPPKLRVRHILLPGDPKLQKESEQMIAELSAVATAENFAELARQHSVCPSAAGGGDLGFVRREDLDPAFAELAFQLPVGEVGGPVRTPFGLHLLLVEEQRVPAPLTLEEARPNIITFCKRAAASRRMDMWVQGLRRTAKIELSE